ncbi:MAG: ABC transporter permease [Firmicutes bacterium]|nr:ABC transporter permease [Bacillota bacterium]
MEFIFRLAIKNLTRHRLRTIVSIAAIAVCVMVVVFARGLVEGMINSAIRDHIYYNSGHIKVVDHQYHEQERLLPLNHPVDGWAGNSLDEMIADLEGIDRVDMVIPRLKFGAMVSTETELVTMTGWGVDRDKELRFTNIEDHLVEGRLPSPGTLEVVMGTKLLEKIGRRVGDKVTIVFNTAFGSLNGVTFTVVGRLQTGLQLLNEYVFFLPLDEAQRLLYMEGQVTELLVAAKDLGSVPQVLSRIKTLLADKGEGQRYTALSYRETSDLVAWADIGKTVYNAIYVFLILLACIVVVNTMLMIVQERTKEIGTMSALGLEQKGIVQLFLLEGGIMGIVGSLMGALLGGGLNEYLARVGLDFTADLEGVSAEVLIDTIIYPESSWSNTLFAFFLGVVIVTLSCLIPARRAANLEPTVAMRDA